MNKLKKIALIVTAFVFNVGKTAAQSGEDYNLFVSGGIHGGLLTTIGVKEVPYNVHADKLISNSKLAVGAGYSCDFFRFGPLFATSSPAIRQNFRIRLCRFNDEADKPFVTYQGITAGASFWKYIEANENNGHEKLILPTFQYLFGFKVKLNESFFWQTELAFGAPYSVETGIGVKF